MLLAPRSAQLGLDTVIVEGSRYGGTCLIRGCIPSKAMIHAAERFESLSEHSKAGGHMGISVEGDPTLDMKGLVSWKDSIVDRLNKGVESLLKSAGAEVIHGWATFTGPKTCSVDSNGQSLQIEAENVILATGSTHIDLPFMPCDEEMVLSSTGALDLQELPAEVAIIGGATSDWSSDVPLEIRSKVTVIEGMDDILAMMDKEIGRPLEIWLKKHGVVINRGALARGVEIIEEEGGKKKARLTYEIDDEQKAIDVDKVLVTVGRRANLEGWGLEKTGVRLGNNGRFIRTDRRCRTNIPGVFAIGDVAGDPMLAHKASAEGEMVAEIIAGLDREFDKVAIPAIIFTEPEIVSVGLIPKLRRRVVRT